MIYQYWDGPQTSGCKASVENIMAYAKRIGADHMLDLDTKWQKNLGSLNCYYGMFKPIFTNIGDRYDNIVVVDTDIFAVDGTNENIFDNFIGEIGIAEETWQPQYRAKRTKHHICGELDERWVRVVKDIWNIEVPRTENNLPRVFNAGLVMWSSSGIAKSRKQFIPFHHYIKTIADHKLGRFYQSDQHYIHAMIFGCDIKYQILDNKWNSFVHQYHYGDNNLKLNDMRTNDTVLVHIQMRGGCHWDKDKLWRVSNLSSAKW